MRLDIFRTDSISTSKIDVWNAIILGSKFKELNGDSIGAALIMIGAMGTGAALIIDGMAFMVTVDGAGVALIDGVVVVGVALIVTAPDAGMALMRRGMKEDTAPRKWFHPRVMKVSD